MRMIPTVVVAPCLTALLVVASVAPAASGQDQVRWAPDFQQAADAAKANNKLVLLHFYSDDCPPCVRVERNVFSQAEVAQAVDRNYVPVKVHVKQTPQLASRYQVNSWPTDVMVNPVGQEVFRSISPQSSADYIKLVDQVAYQAGVGVGRTAQAQAMMQLDAGNNAQYIQPSSSQQQYVAAGGGAWSPAGAGEQTVSPMNAQNEGYNQPQGYSPYQPVQPDVAGQQPPYGAPPAQGYAAAPQSSPYQQYAQPPAQPAPGGYYAGPATQQPSMGAAPPANYGTQSNQFVDPTAQTTQQAIVNNRYASNPNAPQAPATAPSMAAPSAPAPQVAPAAQASIAPASQVASQTPIAQFVPANQAPPMALDGYCPVTILEKTAWTKGDPQFGAVHRGRTYLFASAAEQQKFLGDPDRFSPVLSGYDPVQFTEQGTLVEGKRGFGVTFRNQLFLFADAQSRDRFEQSAVTYATSVSQAMMRSETGVIRR